MDLSFVILTWNSEKFIGRCLAALSHDIEQSGFSSEVFIVDNGSQDGSVSIIENYRDLYPTLIRPIYLSKNEGTTRSRNLALTKTTGKWIVIMDSDVEIEAGLLRQLAEQLQKRKGLGMVVPRLSYPDGKLQKSTDQFPTISTKIRRYFFLKQMEKNESDTITNRGNREVEYAISAFWMFKREVSDKIGFLDENIFYSPEDVDYCVRLWKSGYAIRYCPDAKAVHHTQEISRGFVPNGAFFSHIKGLIYYFRKHRCFFSKPHRSIR